MILDRLRPGNRVGIPAILGRLCSHRFRTKLLLVALSMLSCDSWETSGAPQQAVAQLGSDPRANLLVNPGFEEGREGWSYLDNSPHWGDFEIVGSPVRSGSRAVHLRLHHGPTLPPRKVKVYGVVQDLTPRGFPERLGGWYRVARWEKDSDRTDLYLQVVVIVWGDPRAPSLVSPQTPPSQLQNYQLRYYLAGLSQPAFRLVNARIEFVDTGPPPLGEWKRFQLPLKADFERLWGVVPESYERLTVLFEARWDNMPPRTSVYADVYYDDLFLGYAEPAVPGSRPGS